MAYSIKGQNISVARKSEYKGRVVRDEAKVGKVWGSVLD